MPRFGGEGESGRRLCVFYWVGREDLNSPEQPYKTGGGKHSKRRKEQGPFPGEEKRLVYSRTTEKASTAKAQQWRAVKRDVWKAGGDQILYSKVD